MVKKHDVLFVLFSGILIFTWFFVKGEYFLYYSEQYQLFQFSWLYFHDYLTDIGGIAQYLGNFFLQFNKIIWLGPIVNTVIICSIAFFTEKVLMLIGADGKISFLSIIVAIPFLVLHLDFNYSVGGTVALLLTLIMLYLSLRMNEKIRIPFVFLASLFLFWVTGPFVYQYLILLIISYTIHKEAHNNIISSLLILLTFIILGYLSLKAGFVGDYKQIYLVNLYYAHRLAIPVMLFTPFISIILLLISVPVTQKLKKRSAIIIGIEVAVTIILIAFVFNSKEYHSNKSNSKALELDYYSRTNQWDKIIEETSGDIDNYIYLNYLNLALLQKNLLSDNMFNFDQNGLQSLSVEWNTSNKLSTNILGDVAFATSRVSLAQRYAFEAVINFHNSLSGRNVQRLVETNLVLGHYRVAEKYLGYLSNTIFYKKWAEEHTKFLYNDSLLLQDPILGELRKSLPSSENLVGVEPILAELDSILKANPKNKKVASYMIAYLLLNEDFSLIKYFVESYYGTEALNELPVLLQEAVIMYSEQDEEYWPKYGVSNQVIARYKSFKELYMYNRGKTNIAQLLGAGYKDSYWYYYMFK